jgi:hypothetical protein
VIIDLSPKVLASQAKDLEVAAWLVMLKIAPFLRW